MCAREMKLMVVFYTEKKPSSFKTLKGQREDFQPSGSSWNLKGEREQPTGKENEFTDMQNFCSDLFFQALSFKDK